MSIDWGKTLTSKTIWLGVLMLTAAIVEYYAGLPQGATLIQGISGALTILVRFLTTDAITK